MAAENFELANSTVGGDDPAQLHSSRNAHRNGHARIDRFDTVNDSRRIQLTSLHADDGRRLTRCCNWIRRAAGRRKNHGAAERDAAGYSSWHTPAAWDAADGAAGGKLHGIFDHRCGRGNPVWLHDGTQPGQPWLSGRCSFWTNYRTGRRWRRWRRRRMESQRYERLSFR